MESENKRDKEKRNKEEREENTRGEQKWRPGEVGMICT